MDRRQRGAALLLAALLAGRVLDRLDLPFEAAPAPRAREETVAAPPSAPESTRSGALPRAPSPIGAEPTRPPAPAPPRIAINHADARELQGLPGVGPVLAERIVAERLAGGPFRTMDDLRRVRGIGPVIAMKLALRVRFD
jgi:competence protein ComEA